MPFFVQSSGSGPVNGGAALDALGQERGGDGLARELMSAMNQLLDHSRTQTESMTMMQEEMKNTKEEIKDLRDKCGSMEKLMQENQHSKEADPSFCSQINTRFDDVENRQKYHEILLKNQKWEYPVPVTLDSDDSFTLSAMVDGRRLIHQIVKETCDMRLGRCDGRIYFDYEYVPYNAAFLPHWKEFANALKEYQYALKCFPKEVASELHIRGMDLPKTVVGLLSDALKSTHFKSLSLEDNDFGHDCIQLFALKYMQRNSKLEEFRLDQSPFESNEDIYRLCESIQGHPNIHTIQLNLRDAARIIWAISLGRGRCRL